MKKIILILLSLMMLIQTGIYIWIQTVYSKAIKIQKEEIICARINSNYVSIGNGLCFDTRLTKKK